ncbi:hypothetical protein E2986_11184 [Frieseomelitta varia]|uniref:Uncharacterized protein n=1 Tax=Frieseomelitta varia TaxID=561572 RepID=A0A833VWF7_9HYME|nr:hypothetical protein E2986_11184 [Frieseomelitta varia]
MTTRVLLLFMLCAVMYQMCLAKPAKVLQNPESLSPVKHEEVISITDKREQRSPQFGLLGGDYGESDLDVERTFKQRRYRRPQECLEFPCGPIEPVPLGPLGPLRPPVPFGPPVPPVYPPPPLYPEQAGNPKKSQNRLTSFPKKYPKTGRGLIGHTRQPIFGFSENPPILPYEIQETKSTEEDYGNWRTGGYRFHHDEARNTRVFLRSSRMQQRGPVPETSPPGRSGGKAGSLGERDGRTKKGGKNEIESGLSGAYDVQCVNSPRGASFWTLPTPGLFLFTTYYSKFAMLSSSLPQHCARISRAVVGSESIFWLKLSTFCLAVFGQTFDEIVVSSDLNVRRKSKESRQGKRLTNIPSGTTGPPEKSTVLASRFVSNDGSRITSEKTKSKRDISNLQKRYLDMGVTGYLLNSRK